MLVVLFRLLQGFALGGEVGPTTAYIAEAAPPHRRGLYLSMQFATQDAAVLAAGLVGTTLAAHLSAQQFQDWGWRVAMLLGATIVPFGILRATHAARDPRAARRSRRVRTVEAAAAPSRPKTRPYLPNHGLRAR